MRILAAARTLPFHSIGGMQAIAWDLFAEFVRLGHEVTVLTTAIEDRPSPFSASGVRVVPMSGSSPEQYSRQWWRGTQAYVSALTPSDIDAVLSISVAGAAMASSKSALHVPFICQLHGTSWGEAVSKWRSGRLLQWAKSAKNLYWLGKDALILRRFDEIVVVGDVVRRQFDKPPTRWIAAGIPISTIANGVDQRVFRLDTAARERLRRQMGYGETTTLASFCGRLHPQKGAAECIRALAVVRAAGHDLRLQIIGTGPDEPHLRRLAADTACEPAVTFVGNVTRDQIPAYLSASDLFLFPTLRVEGLPMNVLEAIAVGLPCVVATSLEPIFAGYDSVWYAEPNDPASVATGVITALQAARPRQGSLSVEHSLRHCANSYIDLMSRLSGMHAPSQAAGSG